MLEPNEKDKGAAKDPKATKQLEYRRFEGKRPAKAVLTD